ncbi:hypothetical protein [Bacillus wiedmannii]|uniref:hypothetical protein n=1 Tax=Bacillus wiedmannii TaxID=1890302 RepID=UPI0015CF32E9|nr:hypothetical protein [Bacillus wiedmannii]
MNLSISNELELFSKELQRYMSPDALEQLAKYIIFYLFYIKGHLYKLKIIIWFYK